MEFKVGDLVRVKDSYDNDWCNHGDVCTILRVDHSTLRLEGSTIVQHPVWINKRDVEPVARTVDIKSADPTFGEKQLKQRNEALERLVPADTKLKEVVDFSDAIWKSSPEVTVSSGGALRYNKGKPQFSHLSPDFILEMMKGMTKANEKYSYLNYTRKQDVRTAADSLMRHFLKFQQGMDIDEELNTHHLALVAINAMIMFQNLQDFGDEVDNRYSKEKERVQK